MLIKRQVFENFLAAEIAEPSRREALLALFNARTDGEGLVHPRVAERFTAGEEEARKFREYFQDVLAMCEINDTLQ